MSFIKKFSGAASAGSVFALLAAAPGVATEIEEIPDYIPEAYEVADPGPIPPGADAVAGDLVFRGDLTWVGGCPTAREVDTYDFRNVWAGYNSNKVSGASGVRLTLTATSGDGYTTGYSTTTGSSTGVNAKVLSYEANRSSASQLSYSQTTSLTKRGAWTVPRTQSVGWLQYGAWSQKYKWSSWARSGTCAWIKTGGGTATSPKYGMHGFNHS